jgi:3-mercaptopyruvate sulfurtransferase SseA
VQILNEKGVTNAAALIGGTQAWKNAGYPMTTGGKSDSKNPGNSKETKPSNN